MPASTAIRNAVEALVSACKTGLPALLPAGVPAPSRVVVTTSEEYVDVDGRPASADLPAIVLVPRIAEPAGGHYLPGAREVAATDPAGGTYTQRAQARLVDVRCTVIVQAKHARDLVALVEAVVALGDDLARSGLTVAGQDGARSVSWAALPGSQARWSEGIPEAQGELAIHGLRIHRDTTTTAGPLAEHVHTELRDLDTEQALEGDWTPTAP